MTDATKFRVILEAWDDVGNPGEYSFVVSSALRGDDTGRWAGNAVQNIIEDILENGL